MRTPSAKHIGVSAIVLGTGDTEPVAQTVELLGIDRVYDEASIDQRIDNRSVRYFDRYGDSARRSRDREQPVTQLCQTRTTMREFSLSCDDTLGIDNTCVVLFRAPVDASKPRKCSLEPSHLSLYTRAVTTPAVPVLALEGATSYWASVVANPPGHMSKQGFKHRCRLGRSRRVGPPSQATDKSRPGAVRGTGVYLNVQ